MSQMKAGFARLDITPPLGVGLAGYFYSRPADGVLDPLYINAIALQEGDRTIAVVVCDLLGMYCFEQTGWGAVIAEQTGIPQEQLFLHCTHTHTGPLCCGQDGADPQYEAWLLRRLSDAVTMAVRDCKPVTAVLGGESVCPDVTHARRFRMKGGYYQTWAEYCDPNIEGWACQADESLRLVRILRDGGEELALINFQCHPDCVNGTQISADYPGMVRARIEQAMPGIRCVFFYGAAGQLVTNDWWHGTTSRLPYEKAVEAADKLVPHILSVWNCVCPVEGSGIGWGQEMVRCKTKRDSSRVPEAKRLMDLHNAGRTDEIGPDWVAVPLIAEARKLLALEEAQLDYADIRISAVSFGGLAFAGIAGEPFCELGKAVRESSPFPMTVFCALANGAGDYFPTAEAFDQDGYEPRNCRFAKGVGEHLASSLSRLINDLHCTSVTV